MWKIRTLDTEITNRCNAACPQCPRTGTYENGVSKIIATSGLYDVDPEVFDEILTSFAGRNIENITYCGNYGDPIMHPQAMEIFQKVAAYGVKRQRLDTNAGTRSVEWWSELGAIPGMECNFALDGLEDTNHLYRVKTNWSRIMENVEAFIKAGGDAHWVYIVFEHNEHQVEEAKALSEKMGFKSFKVKMSTRKFNPKTPMKPNVNEYKKKKDKESTRADINWTKRKDLQSDMLKEGFKEFPIEPLCQNKGQMFLSSDAQIMPCCHVQPTLWERKFLPETHKKEPEFADFMENNKVKLDVMKYGFDEIIESFTDVYPHLATAWDARTLGTCNRKCGSNFKNTVKKL